MPLASVNGVKIYYETHGEGEALMLISGTGASCDGWRKYQVPAFAKHHKVVIFDHRGVGKSDKPDETYSTRGFAADAVGLMEFLGIVRCSFIGHSMGGRVAQWIALDYPQRIYALVLSSSGSGKFSASTEVVRGLPLKQTEAMVKQGYEDWWTKHLSDADFMFPMDVREQHDELMRERRALAQGAMPPLRPYLRHVIARQQHETTDLLRNIKAPTLVIVGGKDVNVGGTGNHLESSKVLAERIPNAELVVIEGAAHGYMWQYPENANSVMMNFIDNIEN